MTDFPFKNGKMDFGPALKKLEGKFFSDKFQQYDDYFNNKIRSSSIMCRGRYNLTEATALAAQNFIIKNGCFGYFGPKTDTSQYKLHNLIYKIKEDVVIVELDENGNDYISFVDVCAPQSWSPTASLGKSVSETHQMVPGKLNGSWENILKACLSKGPYERFQWSIKNTDQLNLHPSLGINSTDFEYTNHDIFIRIETQHIAPLIEGKSFIFSILTEHKRLSSMQGEDLMLLKQSIEGMSADEIKYKGLVEHKSDLCFYIKKVAGGLWI